MIKKLCIIIIITVSPFSLKADDALWQHVITHFGDNNRLGHYGQPEPIIRRFIGQHDVAISIISNNNNVVGSIEKNNDNTLFNIPANVTSANLLLAKGANQLRVDSFYKLDDFILKDGLGGIVTSMALNGHALDDDTTFKNIEQGMLTLKGWAGDFNIGQKYNIILLTLCGNIVGFAEPNLPSPMARAMHRNLDKAGFTATLQVQSLPRCAEPYLQIFAYDDTDNRLLKIVGAIHMPLKGSQKAGYGTHNIIEYNPNNYRKLTLHMAHNHNNKSLYQCAALHCNVVTILESYKGDGSSLEVTILDETDDFYLVKNDHLIGWLAKN